MPAWKGVGLVTAMISARRNQTATPEKSPPGSILPRSRWNQVESSKVSVSSHLAKIPMPTPAKRKSRAKSVRRERDPASRVRLIPEREVFIRVCVTFSNK